MPILLNEITAMDGFTIRVGQEVEFWGSGTHGHGIVREIHDRSDRVLIDPDESRCEVDSGRWTLNEQAAQRHGRPDFWEPRDHGVSLGCIKRPHWGWAPVGRQVCA